MYDIGGGTMLSLNFAYRQVELFDDNIAMSLKVGF
jgi:hypothetical protein